MSTTPEILRALADRYAHISTVLWVDEDAGGRPVRLADVLRDEADRLDGAAEPDGLLTAAEHAVVRRAGELWNAICAAVEGPTRDADLRELVPHVHAIQHAFMANAAARAYPETYRRLGSSLRTETPRD